MKKSLYFLLLAISFGFAQIDYPNTLAGQLFKSLIKSAETTQIIGKAQEEINFPPKHKQAEVIGNFSQPPAISPGQVLENFEMSIVGQEKTLSRELIKLQLTPKNGFSPSWMFWVDSNTGLGLAYKQIDAEGNLLASGRYTDIESINIRERRRIFRDRKMSPDQEENLRYYLSKSEYLLGYSPANISITHLGGENGLDALRVTFWDGLNSVLLFVVPGKPRLPNNTNYLMSKRLKELTVIALGPLPDSAMASWLEEIAQGPLSDVSEERLKQFIASKQTK